MNVLRLIHDGRPTPARLLRVEPPLHRPFGETAQCRGVTGLTVFDRLTAVLTGLKLQS